MLSLIAAILVALLAGYIGNKLMGSPVGGLLPTLGAGLLGCLVGYFFFTTIFSIGDDDVFDLGGLLGAILGTLVVLALYKLITKK